MAQRMESVALAGAVTLRVDRAACRAHRAAGRAHDQRQSSPSRQTALRPTTPSRPSNPALPQQGHHHEGCVADRRSHTRGGTPKLPRRDRRCPDAIDVLCVNHRRSSIYLIAERWPAVGRVPQLGIVTRVRWDEPSSALLQSGRFGAVLLSRDVNRRLLLAPTAGSRVSTDETAPILRAPRPARGAVAMCGMWSAISRTSTTSTE